MSKSSFLKGYNQVQRKDMVAVRTEIMSVLNFKDRQAFYARLHGKVEPRVSEAEAIEAVFKKYGITEIWGN